MSTYVTYSIKYRITPLPIPPREYLDERIKVFCEKFGWELAYYTTDEYGLNIVTKSTKQGLPDDLTLQGELRKAIGIDFRSVVREVCLAVS